MAGKAIQLPPDRRPCISLDDLDLAKITAAAWKLLADTDQPPTLFRYGDALARISSCAEGEPTIEICDSNRWRHEVSRRLRWVRTVSGRVVGAFPSIPVIQSMISTPHRKLPRLRHVVSAPIFAADGTLSCTNGYCTKTHTFLAMPTNWLLPHGLREPTADAVRNAADLFAELLCDFRFKSESDFAHAVALGLLPFVASAIEGPFPLHLLDKPTPGSGAGLLTDVLMWPAFGMALPRITEGEDEDEWRKRITSALIKGRQVIVIDNVSRQIKSAALAAVITEDLWSDRLLGHSRMIEIEARRVWIATGNNIQMSDEFARRVVRIRQDPGVERPEERSGFRHPNLRTWVAAHRHELVVAALTICSAWFAAGRPPGNVILGRFENWSRTIGGILEVAGVRGFLRDRAETVQRIDPTSLVWTAFFDLWEASLIPMIVTSADLWNLVQPQPDLCDGLGLFAPTENGRRTQLGQALARMEGRVFGGRRLVKLGYLHGACRWRLEGVGALGALPSLEESVDLPAGGRCE